jgi:hypothetical protein
MVVIRDNGICAYPNNFFNKKCGKKMKRRKKTP